VSLFEQAVTAYVDRRLALMEETVARLGGDLLGAEVADD